MEIEVKYGHEFLLKEWLQLLDMRRLAVPFLLMNFSLPPFRNVFGQRRTAVPLLLHGQIHGNVELSIEDVPISNLEGKGIVSPTMTLNKNYSSARHPLSICR